MTTKAKEYLAGSPAPKRVREVRAVLKGFGVNPQPRQWKLTWEWANKIRMSYYDPRWPNPNEIAAQYLALLIVEFRETPGLRLPYRASQQMPIAVGIAISGAGPTLAIANPVGEPNAPAE